MSYTIEVLVNESIIWQVLGADYDFEVDVASALREEMKILNATPKPMVIVIDILAFQDLDIDGILYFAGHGFPPEVANHPQMRGIIIISTSAVVAAAAKGMDSNVFGFVKLDIVTSPEAAQTRARQLLA
ncbi:MAG TPA: hypothetical protein VHP83_18390 [Aggregatilineaceae bacterium]|nr:hypothetical protein [Aggregatilineaceae bacterium]